MFDIKAISYNKNIHHFSPKFDMLKYGKPSQRLPVFFILP